MYMRILDKLCGLLRSFKDTCNQIRLASKLPRTYQVTEPLVTTVSYSFTWDLM